MQDIKKLQRYKIFYHRALLDDAMPFGKNPTLSTPICCNCCNELWRKRVIFDKTCGLFRSGESNTYGLGRNHSYKRGLLGVCNRADNAKTARRRQVFA